MASTASKVPLFRTIAVSSRVEFAPIVSESVAKCDRIDTELLASRVNVLCNLSEKQNFDNFFRLVDMQVSRQLQPLHALVTSTTRLYPTNSLFRPPRLDQQFHASRLQFGEYR